jgi:hypothetical protein
MLLAGPARPASGHYDPSDLLCAKWGITHFLLYDLPPEELTALGRLPSEPDLYVYTRWHMVAPWPGQHPRVWYWARSWPA